MDDREVTAERQQIPGAIDVRNGLQQADDTDAEHARQCEIAGRTARDSQPRHRKARGPQCDRRHDDDANRPATAGMQEALDPPVMSTDPAYVLGIEEYGASDPQIEVGECEQRGER